MTSWTDRHQIPEIRKTKKSAQVFNALAAGRLDRLRSLLRQGVSPNICDERGNLPLILAIRAGNAEAVRLLVEAGAKVNPKVRHHCDLPIMIAVNSVDHEIFQILLEHGAFPGPFTKGRSKGYVSAFYDAVYGGHRDAVRLLLAHGFKLGTLLETGFIFTPLMLAAEKGHANLVRDFLEAGAPVDQTDELGRTALSCAVIYNLEAYGSDQIADENHQEVIKQLLAAGANPNYCDAQGRSILSWATERGTVEIIELLKAYGATD